VTGLDPESHLKYKWNSGYCCCSCLVSWQELPIVCVCDFYYINLFNLYNVTKMVGERKGLVLFRNMIHQVYVCETWEFCSGVVTTSHLKLTVSSVCSILIWSMIHSCREAVCSKNLSDVLHLIFYITNVHSSLVLISPEGTIHSFLIWRVFRSKKVEMDGPYVSL
jgi:hypothetical protein